MGRIFISYASEDREVALRLYRDLRCAGFEPWIDVVDLLPGVRWDGEIKRAIKESSHLIAIMSSSSVNKRGYVQKELCQALEILKEFSPNQIFVIPARLDVCKPTHAALEELQWVDLFPSYESGVERILAALGQGEEKLGNETTRDRRTLSEALDTAQEAGLFPLGTPFHRPFQYIGMPIERAAKLIGETPNKAGNIVVEIDDACMLLEAEGNFINYVDVALKKTAPCRLTQGFDSEPLLAVLSINPSELELARKQPHYHTYYDHKRKLKIGVSCDYDDGPLSVGFSSKYYGM